MGRIKRCLICLGQETSRRKARAVRTPVRAKKRSDKMKRMKMDGKDEEIPGLPENGDPCPDGASSNKKGRTGCALDLPHANR